MLTIYNKRTVALKNTVIMSMLTAVFTVCAYIYVPFSVPFTLQTFALSLSLVLVGWINTLKVLGVYTALGVAGLPVFSTFRGGIAALLEPSGGFIIGFFTMCGMYALLEKALPCFEFKTIVSLVLSLSALYACGSMWYNFIYLSGTWGGFASSVAVCVLPYVLPDIAKVVLGSLVAKRLSKYIHIQKNHAKD